MVRRSFRDLEHAGWLEKAAAYDNFFANITTQSIDAILDALGHLGGKSFLDIACGTGHLAAAAASRGAAAEGIDFAATMVARAAGHFPDCVFTEGDAEALPYGDCRFDAAACSFGLLHLENPDRALNEARRVLIPGGRFAFTVWCGPDQGGEMYSLVLGAVEKHGRFDVDLPPAPPMFRLADTEESERAMHAAGFVEIETRMLSNAWRPTTPQDVLDMIYKSLVRMPIVLNAQTASDKEQIHVAILKGAEDYRRGADIVFQFPALLVTGRRPA